MSMTASSAERVARHRRRRRIGATVLAAVEITDELGTTDLLVAAGLLFDHERDDKLAIAAAVGRFVDLATRQHLEEYP